MMGMRLWTGKSRRRLVVPTEIWHSVEVCRVWREMIGRGCGKETPKPHSSGGLPRLGACQTDKSQPGGCGKEPPKPHSPGTFEKTGRLKMPEHERNRRRSHHCHCMIELCMWLIIDGFFQLDRAHLRRRVSVWVFVVPQSENCDLL